MSIEKAVCPIHHLSKAMPIDGYFKCYDKACVSTEFCPDCGHHTHRYRGLIILEGS